MPEYEVNLDYYTNDIDYNEDTVHNGKQGYENIYAVVLLSDWFIIIKYQLSIGNPVAYKTFYFMYRWTDPSL